MRSKGYLCLALFLLAWVAVSFLYWHTLRTPVDNVGPLTLTTGMIFYNSAEKNPAADLDLISYMITHKLSGISMFHLGTGTNHAIGMDNLAKGNLNAIVALTASTSEYTQYINLLAQNGSLASGYIVFLSDVFCLRDEFLPQFDIIALFHLGEYFNSTIGESRQINSNFIPSYPRMDQRKLIGFFIEHLKPNGRLIAYKKSSGWEVEQPLFEEAVSQRLLVFKENYRSLIVFITPPK